MWKTALDRFWRKSLAAVNRNTAFAQISATLCGFAMVVMMAGCQRDISGAYLTKDQNSVCWLQVVRTPDDHLTGQLANSILNEDGSVRRDSVAITGAVDGENVTLSASRFLGLATVTLSGTVKGNTLTLANGTATPAVFKRSTMATFQADEAALDARSQSILQAKAAFQERKQVFQAQRSFVAQVDSLTGKMAAFNSEADVHMGRFPGAEMAYESITAKVAAYVSRERRYAGNPNASVIRGQLSVAATQASLQTNQIHNQALSLASSLQGKIRPLVDQAASLERGCGGLDSNRFTPAEVQNINAACSRLSTAIVPFQQKYNAMAAGLAHLEQVYQREQSTQQRLIQESERLE